MPDAPRVDAGATPRPLPLTGPQHAGLVSGLRESVLGGLLAAGRLLAEREGEQALSLGGDAGRAMAESMPPAFRSWFDDLRSIRLWEAGGAIRVEFRFGTWVPPRAISLGSVRLHDVGVFLARDRVVTARLVLEDLEDLRAHGDSVPYRGVKKAPDDVFVKAAAADVYPGGHPFRSGGHRAPTGVDNLRGITLVASVSGFWLNVVEIMPVTRMFTYRGESDIWVSYLDTKEYEADPDETPPVGMLDPDRLFLDYTRRHPQPSDELVFFNMSANSRNAHRQDADDR
ncbi:MAG: hypothetical protein ACYS22_01190 [Planctomycetota bacterium]